MKLKRNRRSAKNVIKEYCYQLLSRKNDPSVKYKLLALEAIALRMSWHDIYELLRFNKNKDLSNWD